MITKNAAKLMNRELLAAGVLLDANLRKLRAIQCDLDALVVTKKAREARGRAALDRFLGELLAQAKFTVEDFTRWITRQ